MTPEEKTKAMKLRLNSIYGKMATESFYADTDSFHIRKAATVLNIPEAIEAIKEMKEGSFKFASSFPLYVGGTVIKHSKPTFDIFCDALIEILQDAERKLNA